MKLELSGIEGFLQVREEQTSKEARQDPDGKEESLAGRDPAVAVGRQTAAGNDAVDMGVMV